MPDARTTPPSRPPVLVLVHGAFHGAWCFEPLRRLLDEHGIATIAPDLPLESVASDADAVRAAIDEAGEPVTLLGHSYGGTIITWAGEVVPHAAWRSRPAHYVVCRDDRVLPVETQRWLAARAGAQIHELEGDHSPFLTRPKALADILREILDPTP